MSSDNPEAYASRYAERPPRGTDYLAFRDLPRLFAGCAPGSKALDFGCGTGRSSRFLKSHGFAVVGVDKNPAMTIQAKRLDPDGDYRALDDDALPFPDERFDLVFSTFVVLELPTLEILQNYFREAARVLRTGGVMLVVANTPEFYAGDWISCRVNFAENRPPLQSGQKVRVVLTPEEIELLDTYWADEDYREAFAGAGFTCLEVLRPIGKPEDPVDWKDEVRTPPYVVYWLRK